MNKIAKERRIELVNVLFTGLLRISDEGIIIPGSLSDEHRQQIITVGPKVKLRDVSDLVRAERRGDFTSKEQFDALLAEAEVIYGLILPRNVIARAPQLKWVQVMAAGVDRFLNTEILASPVIMTSVSGIHATPIGEFVLGLMLMFVKRAPLCFQL